MAEMLTYAPDLRSLTGGQGDYTMEFAALRGGPGAPRAEGRRGRGQGGREASAAGTRPGARAADGAVATLGGA